MSKNNSNSQYKHEPRELPSYSLTEAAHYLCMPVSTLRSWVVGRHYLERKKKKFFKPIIYPAQISPYLLLSFNNLVEAHILNAIRRKHNISLNKVRKALAYLGRHFPSKHPLTDNTFVTDGLDLFIEKYGQLVSISREGQLAIMDLLRAHLSRIERGPDGLPVRLYLFTRRQDYEEPKTVVIDPKTSFGRPVLAGTGIPTLIIAERYKAGESINELAKDYGIQKVQIEEAIRCELYPQAA
ncbi:MAG: DUF433 domain-containing protein [Nitrospirae bacterium]|nr:DUF433 domain-containing protein [Nitrospirota bacterium]